MLKLNSHQVAHKTEIGAVVIGLGDENAVQQAIGQMKIDVQASRPDLNTEQFLLETMLPTPVAELMVNVRHDEQFGLILTLSSGGIFVELFKDAVTLILPIEDREIHEALDQLKIAPMLHGYRGKAGVRLETLVKTIQQLVDYMTEQRDRIAEIEINPVFVYPDAAYAVDVLTQIYQTK